MSNAICVIYVKNAISLAIYVIRAGARSQDLVKLGHSWCHETISNNHQGVDEEQHQDVG